MKPQAIGKRVIFYLLLVVIIGVVVAFLIRGSSPDGGSVSFADFDLTAVTAIVLGDLHTGRRVTISEPDDIARIIGFVQGIRGVEGQSGKGWSGGTYDVEMMVGDEVVFGCGFGDMNDFYHGSHAVDTGYPVRYTYGGGTTKEEVVAFLPLFC